MPRLIPGNLFRAQWLLLLVSFSLASLARASEKDDQAKYIVDHCGMQEEFAGLKARFVAAARERLTSSYTKLGLTVTDPDIVRVLDRACQKIDAYMDGYWGWSVIEPRFTELYGQMLSADEIHRVYDFLQTEVGQDALAMRRLLFQQVTGEAFQKVAKGEKVEELNLDTTGEQFQRICREHLDARRAQAVLAFKSPVSEETLRKMMQISQAQGASRFPDLEKNLNRLSQEAVTEVYGEIAKETHAEASAKAGTH